MTIRSVFISYTACDFTIASAISNLLLESELDVWFAPKDLQPGTHFDEIFRRIESTDVFVVLLSNPALNSPWVCKEVNLAIMNQLGGHASTIVPCYLDTGDLLFGVSDIKPIYLRRSELESGLAQIRDVVLDKYSDPALNTFEAFLNRQIHLPDLDERDLFSARYAGNRVAKQAADPVLAADETIRQLEMVSEESLTCEQRDRIRTAVHERRPLPIVPGLWLTHVLRFARQADGLFLQFAAQLPDISGTSRVTRNRLEEICEGFLGELYPKISESITRWQNASLIAQAQNLGLFEPTREVPRNNDDIIEFLVNPSYDLTELTRIVAPLIGEFLRHKKQIVANK